MKISAISSNISKTQFNGNENKKGNKANTLKTAAGATVIALATAIPSNEAKAQYFVPVPPHIHYYVPAPVMNIPNCFIYGDETNENYEKTMPDVFSEIDREIKKDNQISVNEVVSLEEYNWNSTHAYPMTRAQKLNSANLVKNLSRNYNDKGSNPNTINYNEYKKIMNAYMASKNVADFINLLQILTPPCHQHYVTPPHRHKHHRH